MNNFHFKSFSDLDNDSNADFFINSMDIMYSIKEVQSIKKRAIASMNLNIGDKVLEVGCGHGQDVEIISKIIGDEGSVVGIDSSVRMISEAKKLSKQTNAEYLVMSAKNINFNDSFFSACHADRLLVGHQDYNNIFDEILRVLKPGGTISITDVDALSIIMYPFTNSTQKILNQIHRSFINPFIGRSLPALFVEKNLKNIQTFPDLLMINDFNILAKIFNFSDIINELILRNELTIIEGNNWLDSMLKASQEGSFMYCVSFFTTTGQKNNINE
jgi:ubiquinone/menaquinone biosynthesis C-methylase UbiE